MGTDPPSPQVVRATVEAHCRHWNARDRQAWTALFAPDITFDDPVGAPTKHGSEAVRSSWERSLAPGRSWLLTPERIVVCGNQAAVVMRNDGNIHGKSVVIGSIEIWTVGSEGLVHAVRAYFEPDPALNDSYFVPGIVPG